MGCRSLHQLQYAMYKYNLDTRPFLIRRSMLSVQRRQRYITTNKKDDSDSDVTANPTVWHPIKVRVCTCTCYMYTSPTDRMAVKVSWVRILLISLLPSPCTSASTVSLSIISRDPSLECCSLMDVFQVLFYSTTPYYVSRI